MTMRFTLGILLRNTATWNRTRIAMIGATSNDVETAV